MIDNRNHGDDKDRTGDDGSDECENTTYDIKVATR